MATLAEINETLIRVDDNTETTSKGINSFVTFLKDTKRKDLENAREAKNATVKMRTEATTNKGGQKEKDGGSILDTIRNMLAGATLAKLASTIGKGVIKRVLGPAVIATFSDEIVDFLLPDGFENQAIRDALSGALTGGAIGFAVGGPLGAAIGAGLGALFKNERFKKAIGELGTTLKEQGKVLLEKIEPAMIRFKDSIVELFNSFGITKEGVVEGLAGALTFIGNAAASGVESLTRLAKGDFESVGSDMLKGIGLISAVGALLMPGKFLKLFGLLAGIAKGPAGKLITAIRAGGGKLLTSALAALGIASAASSTGDPKKTDSKSTQPKAQPGSVVKSAKGGLFIAGKDGEATVNKAPPGSKVGDVPKSTSGAANKFGRMMKFLRLPGIATLLAGYDIFSILNSDSSRGEKVKALTEVFGGVLGGVAGLKAGGLVGGALGTLGFPLIGTGIGGVLGAGLGYFGGKALAGSIAEFLLGGDPKPKMPVTPKGSVTGMSPGAMGGSIQTLKKPTATGGSEIKSSIQTTERRPDAMGVTSSPTIVDNSNRTNINNNSSAVIGQGNIIDIQDQFLQYT